MLSEQGSLFLFVVEWMLTRKENGKGRKLCSTRNVAFEADNIFLGRASTFIKFVTLCYTGRLFQGLNSHIGITVVSYMELPVLNFPSFASRTPA